MKTLVVGGTGRIGAAVVDAPTPRNDVVVASRSPTVGVDIGIQTGRVYELGQPVVTATIRGPFLRVAPVERGAT